MKKILFLLSQIWRKFTGKINYKDYWDKRYKMEGNSGAGSYGLLAEFKAKVINRFIENNKIKTAVEFGCGDGNNLKMIHYPTYLGLDVATSSIEICKDMFKDDKTKSFIQYTPKTFYNNGFFTAELVLCLDVLYHIIPEDDFYKTLDDIFSTSSKYVILYTNTDPVEYRRGGHQLFRDTKAVLAKYPQWEIVEIVEQEYKDLSPSDFYILKRKA